MNIKNLQKLHEILKEAKTSGKGKALNIGDVVPSIFAREWKCAKTNPPEEVGRYWCLIEEQNDLGVSYYQWNCSYSKEVGFSKPDHNVIKITHWTELLPCPV